MWNKILKYIDSIGNSGCFTPDTKLDNTNPPTKPKESKLEESRRIYNEQLQIDNKETNERLKLLRSVCEKFGIGEQVEYLKIPNVNVKFYVSDFRDYMLHANYNGRLMITKSIVSVQYFDANQIIHTITDESKWFKKV